MIWLVNRAYIVLTRLRSGFAGRAPDANRPS
jgi:hypothetical protein